MTIGAEGTGRKILIVDDEARMRRVIADYLRIKGYETAEAADGVEALEKFAAEPPDLVLLDVMMPRMDGWEVCRRIRARSQVPVIMLTAKGDDMDKILGLEYGADDYMVKPFNILEVKARIRSVLRRMGQQSAGSSSKIAIRDLEIDLFSRSVVRGGVEIALTSKEFDLLHVLMENPGRVFDRKALMEMLNAKDRSEDSIARHDLRTVDVYVRRLREKVEKNPANPEYIMTRWGVGYYFANK